MTRPDAIVWLPIPRWLVSAGALVCLVVLTCVPVPANARDPDFVSWKKTCNTATSSYRDRILTAYCNFSSQPSSLNTSDCRSGPLPAVVSYGGKLRCHYLSDHGVSGTYLKGCLANRARRPRSSRHSRFPPHA
jgi:hypothetical protein